MTLVDTLLRLPGRTLAVPGWSVVTETVHRRRRGMPARAEHVTPAGVRLRLDLGDWVQRTIYYDSWEVPELALVRSLVRPGDVMLDVGANIGLFALTAARAGAVTHAFEPVPANVDALRANAALNPGAPVEVFAAALGDAPGTMLLGLPTEHDSGARMSGFFTRGGTHRQVECPVTTIDAHLAAHGIARVRVMKMDVEGAEPLVLDGAARTLAAHRIDVILLEASVYALGRQGYGLGDLVRPLTAGGYHLFRLASRGRLQPWHYRGEPSVPARAEGPVHPLRSVVWGIQDLRRHFNLVAVRGDHPALSAGRIAVRDL